MSESPEKPVRPPLTAVQVFGALWALAYGIGIQIWAYSTAKSSADMLFGIIWIWAPVASFVVTFAALRTGDLLAFIVLALASLLAANQLSQDMAGMTQTFSAAIMFLASPFVLARGLAAYRRYVARAKRNPWQSR